MLLTRAVEIPTLWGAARLGEEVPVERRLFLKGTVASSAGALLPTGASAVDAPPADLSAALARFRASIPTNFNRDYVEHAVIPFFLTSIYEGERPALPMIDVTLTKENALPFDSISGG